MNPHWPPEWARWVFVGLGLALIVGTIVNWWRERYRKGAS